MDRAEVEERTGIFLRAVLCPRGLSMAEVDAVGRSVIGFLCDFERFDLVQRPEPEDDEDDDT